MKKQLLNQISGFSSLSRFFYSLCFLLLLSMGVYGQGQGTVQGRVTGADDESPLLAATVVVKGTTTGTVTDRNGQFILAYRSGIHTLQISYIGYETVEEVVTIEQGQSTEMSVALPPATIMGEEAVITAQARGQLAAVNQQLRSNQIVNVVSSERIRELPDENAAQAISRLPGVHLSGSSIVVRGIQPKMNKILINGVEMPSTSASDRSTSLGMISSNMLSGIEVFKTLTPDMDADAIGGTVNLRLREAPEGFHYNVMTQGTYNQQEKLIGNYKVWGDVSNRFLDNKLGVSLNLNYEKSQGGSDAIGINYGRVTAGEIGKATYMFGGLNVQDNINRSEDIGGTLVLDFKVPGGNLVYTSMLTHSTPENIRHEDNMIIHNYSTQRIQMRHSKSQTLLLNNALHYNQQIGIVKLDAGISAISIDKEDEYSYFFRFESITNAFMMDSLTNEKKLKMEPWEIYEYAMPNLWQNYRTRTCQISPSDFNEERLLANLNLEIPLRISDNISLILKSGGKYKRMQRAYDRFERNYYQYRIEEIHEPIQDWLVSIGHENWASSLFFRDFRDYDYKTNDGFMNGDDRYGMPYVIDVDLMDKMFVDLLDPNTIDVVPGNFSEDYWGGEDLYAGYLMTEISLGNRLLIIPGLRYERVRNEYTAMKVAAISSQAYQVIDTLTRPAAHENWLPHLHLRYRLTDWWDVRVSYNNTLSRPDYTHAVPKVYYNVIGSSGTAGNPYIRPAVSENLDANFTFYSRKLGLITIGGFMKQIDDIFYGTPTIIKNLPDSTIMNEFPLDQYPALKEGATNFYINNPNPAYLRGMEVEWQSNLSWLPSPFNGLVFNVNYTKVWSETDYPQHRVSKEYISVPPYVVDVENDTIFTNRLLHQANDIANVSLGYDYKGFSARLSFRFQGNVISGISSRPEDNSYTNNVYRYDLVMKQKLPIKVANMELFFNAINFTNVPSSRYSIYPNKGETITSLSYSGRRFQLGLRLTK